MIDLIQETEDKTNRLNELIENLAQKGRALAENEALYKIALATKITELRNNGIPVTIISDLSRGDKDIAKRRMNRDIAETDYRVCLEAINVTKLQLKLLENQTQREWGNCK